MAFKINGFGGNQDHRETPKVVAVKAAPAPRKSLVQIQFPNRGGSLAYFNDLYDLKLGDLVYVSGKLEGQQGRVVEISYNFKIKISEYQKVIARVDTQVHGQFHMAGSHLVTFDPSVLPAEKAALWFNPPVNVDEEIVSCTDDSCFPLNHMQEMGVTAAIAQRGHDYYTQSRVRYLCLNGTKGFAVVEGTHNYAVEFDFEDGQISHLLCECPCSYRCKHEFAAMLQLQETLELIEKHYAPAFRKTGYFAAVYKATLFDFAVAPRETGSLTI